MATPVDQRTTYDCSAATLHATLTDVQYWKYRVEKIGNGSYVVDHRYENGGATSEVEQALDSATLPKALQRLAGSTMSARCVESWSAPGEDGSATGSYRLATSRMPVIVEGDLELIPDGAERCTLHFTGTVDAAIPVMGPVVEKIMVGEMDRSFSLEREFTMEWLASLPG